MKIFLSIIIFIYTLNVQNSFEVLKTKSGREFKIFKGNDGKTIFFEFCIEKQKKECLVELLVFDLRGVVSLLKENPKIGTTDIQDNGKIIRTKDGFTHLVTPNGASSEGVGLDLFSSSVFQIIVISSNILLSKIFILDG